MSYVLVEEYMLRSVRRCHITFAIVTISQSPFCRNTINQESISMILLSGHTTLTITTCSASLYFSMPMLHGFQTQWSTPAAAERPRSYRVPIRVLSGPFPRKRYQKLSTIEFHTVGALNVRRVPTRVPPYLVEGDKS